MTTYVHKEECEVTHLDGEWVILNPNQMTVTKVNEVGGYCWSLLNAKQTVKTLTDAVSKKYSQVEEKDIQEYLDQLVGCDLLVYEI